MKLHEKIFNQRRLKGLSQEELAEKIGVSRQAVSKWETGEALPEITKLKALADIFGVIDDRIRCHIGNAHTAAQIQNGGTIAVIPVDFSDEFQHNDCRIAQGLGVKKLGTNVTMETLQTDILLGEGF